MQTLQTEQDIRFFVNKQLENLGWVFKGTNRNVFQEQPRDKDEKKKLGKKRPDYVLYSNTEKYRREPLMIIETKKPGANLNDALQQGNFYAEKLDAPLVFATDGIYYKTLHMKVHKPLYLNGEEVNELIRELEAIKFLDSNEVDTISKELKYSRDELIKIFYEANDLLRSEGLKAGMERFSEFANILFLKLLGETEDLKEKKGEAFKVSNDFRWNHWKDKKGEELLRFVNDTVLKEMGQIYKDEKIFTPLEIKNPSTLKRIIDRLEPLKLININSDIKGDAFEYFLQKYTTTKNDLGEYFTPRHIVKTMVKLVNPQISEKIYDPFCGTGGMLIGSFKHISNTMARDERNRAILQEETIFGNEITDTARITKMNMILIGDGHSGVERKDSLKVPVEDKYDVVITNMPYSQKTEYGAYYDLQSSNGDSICIQHCIKAINKSSGNGRMAIIVPEGFLFRKDMQKTREYLLDRCYLKSIISLPQGVFLPYTGVKTNILYCTEIKNKKKQEKFWYFNVKNDGRSLDNRRIKLEGETDLQKFLAYRNTEVQEKKDILSVGFSEISMEDVQKNDLVLVGSRYKQFINYENIKWETVKLSEAAKIGAGNSAPQDNKLFKDGKYPFFRVSDVARYHITSNLIEANDLLNDNGKKGLKLYHKNTILFPKSGASTFLNHRAMLGINGYVSSHLATIEPIEEKVLPKYLFYLLCGIDAKNLTVDQNYPSLRLSEISSLKIPLPPIEKQQEIVNELDSYQKIVDNARELLKNYKPTINIDSNWSPETLGKIASFQYGYTAVAKENGNARFIRITDIDENGKLKNSDAKYIKILKDNQQYILKKGDLLVARTGATFGKTLLFDKDEQAIFASYLIRISLDRKKIIPTFYWIYAQTEDYWKKATDLVGGTGQPQFNANVIKNLTVPLPSLQEQKKIIEKVEKEESLIAPSKEIIRLFENKIQEKLNFIWGK